MHIQMCAHVYLYIRTHAHIYKHFLRPRRLEQSLRQGFRCMCYAEGRLPGEREEEKDRAGIGLSWSWVSSWSARGPWSMNCTIKLVIPTGRGPAFVPLLVSHGPPWEVSGQASCSHWAEKLDPLPAGGWGSSQVSTTGTHVYMQACIYTHICTHSYL